MTVTIMDIIWSLEQRGFIASPNWFSSSRVQTQVDAVIEELGEVARLMRRHAQGREDLDIDRLAAEAADVVIASVCLLACAVGVQADRVIVAKLERDEARGWLHSGMTRDEYEAAPING